MSLHTIILVLFAFNLSSPTLVNEDDGRDIRLAYKAGSFTEHACEESETMRSGADDVLVTISFLNSTSREVSLMHVNKEGREERKADLQSGQTVSIVTHQGHVWVVRDDSNACHTLLKVSTSAGDNEAVTFAERQ